MKVHRLLSAWYFTYFGFVGAFLPYFSLYLESLALSPARIGLLMSLGQAMRMLVPIFWGWLSDRSGRRVPIVRVSAALSVLSFGAYFFTSDFAGLVLASLLLHFFLCASLPLVEALTFSHLRDDPGRYGRIRLWGSVGFVVTVLGVGVLLDRGPIDIVLWCGWTLLLVVLIVAMGLREDENFLSVSTPIRLGSLYQRKSVALLVAGFLMAAAHGPLYVFFSIHLVGNGYDKATTGVLWSLGVIAEILVFVMMPRLAAGVSLKSILLACFALAIARFLVIGWFVDSVALVVFAQVLHGATFGAHHAATLAALNRWFPRQQQGRIQAIYGSLSFGAGGMLGAVLAGQSWQALGAGVTYSIAAGFALIGLVVTQSGMPRENSAWK